MEKKPPLSPPTGEKKEKIIGEEHCGLFS